jgi:hypothetical protein
MMRSDQDLSIALQFIDDHIASFEELELLVALVAAPLRWWDATMLSRELGIPKMLRVPFSSDLLVRICSTSA